MMAKVLACEQIDELEQDEGQNQQHKNSLNL